MRLLLLGTCPGVSLGVTRLRRSRDTAYIAIEQVADSAVTLDWACPGFCVEN